MKLNDLIQDGQVTIFSLTWCSYCVKAKNLLKQKKIPFQSFEIDDKKYKPVLKELQKSTNHYTFPSIFFGLQFIGGFDNLTRLTKTNKFEDLLNKNNVKF